MGLFNFLKKNTSEASKSSQETNKTNEKYLGDLTKTALIQDLIMIPHEKRDEEWQNNFLNQVTTASFRCGTPQIISGPDGFPYFQLLMPEYGKPFDCYVIDNMIDDYLLEKGLGIVVNPDSGNPDWVFTYGDILSYKLFGNFYTDAGIRFSLDVEDETIQGQENIMVAQPSEAILPTYTRKIVQQFLTENGIKKPKVFLMVRGEGENITHDLVFNFTPNDFESEEYYRTVMQNLAWFFPKHYSFVGMNEDNFKDVFEDL